MVYMGSLPEGISHHGRKSITAAHIKKNPHPRNPDENSTVGSLYSLQKPNHWMELSIFNVEGGDAAQWLIALLEDQGLVSSTQVK